MPLGAFFYSESRRKPKENPLFPREGTRVSVMEVRGGILILEPVEDGWFAVGYMFVRTYVGAEKSDQKT